MTDAEIEAKYGADARWTADRSRIISVTVDGYKFRVQRIKSYQYFTMSKQDARQLDFKLEF